MHDGKRSTTSKDLQRELDRLFDQQHAALDRATYLGMTADHAKEIAARRKQITALVAQLAALKQTQKEIADLGGAATPLLAPDPDSPTSAADPAALRCSGPPRPGSAGPPRRRKSNTAKS